MPKPFPQEFRADVIAVARQGDRSVVQVARAFGVSESCLQRWLKITDHEDGVAGPTSPTSSPAASSAGGDLEAENRELRKRAEQLEQENEILRRATTCFARDVSPMMCPLVHDLAADKIPVAVTSRVLGLLQAGVVGVAGRSGQPARLNDAHLINAAIDIHHVDRLCSSQRLWSVHSRKRGLNREPGPPVHDDPVLRDFTAAQPDQLWLTDITEHRTAEGKLHLCAISARSRTPAPSASSATPSTPE